MKTSRRTKAGYSCLFLGLLTLLAGGPPAWATTWYVDGANGACADAGPGTAAAPLCSIQTAARKAIADDRVLVNPARYREQVTLQSSGSPGQPITFQAAGPETIVLGSNDISAPDTWRPAMGTAWCRSLPTSPRQVFVDGARLSAAPGSNAMTASSFFYDAAAQMLYVDIGGGNPGLGHLVEAGARTYGFNVTGASNIVIDGFELMHQNDASVRILNGSSITAQNLTVTFAGTEAVLVESSPGPNAVRDCAVSYSLSNGILVLNSTGVTLSGNRTHHNSLHGISLQGSSNNLLQNNVSYENVRLNIRSATGIDVNAGSSQNTILANTTFANQDSGIEIYNGSNGNLVARNVSWRNGDHGFDTKVSTGTRYVNNTSCRNYKDGFSVEGGSTSTTLANNIAMDNGLTTNEFDLYVDTLSTSGFSSDYDIFWRSAPGNTAKVNGTFYHTLSDFRSTTPNEDHGVDADPLFLNAGASALSTEGTNLRLAPGSPAIDSANSDAPGFVMADRVGFRPADDPNVTNTGRGIMTFADRGAYEGDPPPIATLRVSPSSGPIDLTVSADASGSMDPDDSPVDSYTFDFGDGTVIGPQSNPSLSHTYTVPGTYTLTVTVTDRAGNSASATSRVSAQDDPPAAEMSLTLPSGVIDLPVRVDASASRGTRFSPIRTYTFDFGDGTVVGPQAGPIASHVYTWPGDFTVTLTVANAVGVGRTTSQVAVRDDPPSPSLSVAPALGITALTVTADASGSTDDDASTIAGYRFDFGDGSIVGPQSSPLATHLYAAAGDFTVTVTIVDTAGLRATATAPVKAVQNGAPNAALTVSPTLGSKPLIVTADASASSDTDPAPIVSYSFDFGDGTVVGQQATPRATHIYMRPGLHTVTATVTDTAGLSSRATASVKVKRKRKR